MLRYGLLCLLSCMVLSSPVPACPPLDVYFQSEDVLVLPIKNNVAVNSRNIYSLEEGPCVGSRWYIHNIKRNELIPQWIIFPYTARTDTLCRYSNNMRGVNCTLFSINRGLYQNCPCLEGSDLAKWYIPEENTAIPADYIKPECVVDNEGQCTSFVVLGRLEDDHLD